MKLRYSFNFRGCVWYTGHSHTHCVQIVSHSRNVFISSSTHTHIQSQRQRKCNMNERRVCAYVLVVHWQDSGHSKQHTYHMILFWKWTAHMTFRQERKKPLRRKMCKQNVRVWLESDISDTPYSLWMESIRQTIEFNVWENSTSWKTPNNPNEWICVDFEIICDCIENHDSFFE